MPLSADQEVIVAEIILEPLSVVQAVTLSDEQILWLSDDIDLWEAKRNSIAVELNGKTDYKTQRLLDAIRARTRRMFGLSPYPEELTGSGGSFAIPNIPVF